MRDSDQETKSKCDGIMTEELLEAITKIANNEKLVNHLEPNLFWHQEIQSWMTKRILYAYLLFEKEYKKCSSAKNVKS